MISKNSLLRKAFLIFALIFFAWNATAQTSIHYKLNPQTNKTFDCFGGLKAKIIAEENDLLLITGQTTKSIVINRLPDNIVVRWVDKQLNIQQEYELPESKQYELIATTLIDNSVVLLVGINTKDQYEVRRIVLNKSNLKQTSEESLYTNSKARRGLTLNWFATSEDGDFNALMLVTEKEDNKFDAQILMLDDNLQLLWQRESTMPGCNGMFVSNEGELYMAAASEYKILFAKLTDDDNYQYYIETEKALDRMMLLNVVDNCIIVAGTTHEVMKKLGTKVTGYFSASYNMATGRLEGQDFQNMSGMEEIVLKNWSADTKPQGHSSRLSISNYVATPYGGVMLLSLNRLDVTINNGMRHETYTRLGLLALGVDKNGQISWRQPIRHLEKAGSDEGFRQEMVVEGNKVHIFHLEHKNLPATMDMNKQCPKHINSFDIKCKIVAITIDANGQASKTILAENQKGILLGQDNRWLNDKVYMLYTGKDKSGLFEINRQ